MTNAEFLNDLDETIASRILLIDNCQEWSIDTFLWNNMVVSDVDHISLDDAQRVIDLQIEESILIGLIAIKRIL